MATAKKTAAKKKPHIAKKVPRTSLDASHADQSAAPVLDVHGQPITLEAAKKLVEQLETAEAEAAKAVASTNFDTALSLIVTSSAYFTDSQKNRIVKALHIEDTAADDQTPTKVGRATKKTSAKKSTGVPRGTVRPLRFQLDTGETWSGVGRRNEAFNKFDRSKAGKEWKRAHPDQLYPAYPNKNFKG